MAPLLLLTIMGVFITAEIIMERENVDYYNKKYIKSVYLKIKRDCRKCNYYMNFDIETLETASDNVTVKYQISELVSGRYIPTPVFHVSKFCTHFHKDPLFKETIHSQFPANITCPLPKGEYHARYINALSFGKSEDLLPHLFDSFYGNYRFEAFFYITKTKERIIEYNINFKYINKQCSKIRRN